MDIPYRIVDDKDIIVASGVQLTPLGCNNWGTVLIAKMQALAPASLKPEAIQSRMIPAPGAALGCQQPVLHCTGSQSRTRRRFSANHAHPAALHEWATRTSTAASHRAVACYCQSQLTEQQAPEAGQDNEEEMHNEQGFEPYNDDGSDPNIALLQSLPPGSHTKVKTAVYISSCVDTASCPPPRYPEFAVIGRSNVGKSSLINMLTNSKGLARVSKEPGKTRCINHFLINDSWYLVDLPGYGFARTGLSTRVQFDKFTKDYFLNRPSLAQVYLLADSSIAPQPIDLEYAAWLHNNKMPFCIVFTKADKRKKGQARCRDNVAAFTQALQEEHGINELPPILITSSESGLGRGTLLQLTSVIRDAFTATGKLDDAMLEWERRQVLAPAFNTQQQADSHFEEEIEEQPQLQRSHAKQGMRAKQSARKAQSPNMSKQASQRVLPKGVKAGKLKPKPLPGDEIPLPQWKIRAADRAPSV